MGSDIELMFPALYVECTKDEEFDLNLPPSTGSEYLRRVRLEAAKCPDVVVANIDASRFSTRQTMAVSTTKGCQPAPKGYAPSLAWQRQQAADFSQTRLALAAYKATAEKERKRKRKRTHAKHPRWEDDVGWCKLCFGTKFQNKLAKTGPTEGDDTNMNVDEEGSDGMPPLVSFVASLSQPQVEQVLDYHICWFETTGFSREQGCWFYALLTCLEKPLDPSTCSSLRSLVRLCANLRATMKDDDPHLPHLNLLICLVTRYFGQSDLADDEK